MDIKCCRTFLKSLSVHSKNMTQIIHKCIQLRFLWYSNRTASPSGEQPFNSFYKTNSYLLRKSHETNRLRFAVLKCQFGIYSNNCALRVKQHGSQRKLSINSLTAFLFLILENLRQRSTLTMQC
jgi:hypothetical protein